MTEKQFVEFKPVDASSYAIDTAKEFFQGKEGSTLTEQKAQNNDDTMVTVVCITYHHEKFIAEALDSFLMQKTNFKFKIFVGEDCGSDGTANIVREYAQKYPEEVIPFIREKNMGAQRNLIDLCQRATSPYIAFCEGDDYWIDKEKLQKQVDYMEKHPELRVCYHKVEILAPEDWYQNDFYLPNKKNKRVVPNGQAGYQLPKGHIDAEHIIRFNPAQTSSLFFRWNYDLDIPDWYYEGIIGDVPLILMQMGNGYAGFIPEIMSIYRRGGESVFHFSDLHEHFLKTRLHYIHYLTGIEDYFSKYYGNYCQIAIRERIRLETANYFNALLKDNNIDEIISFMKQYPKVTRYVFQTYLANYFDIRRMINHFRWGNEQLIARDRQFMRMIAPLIKGAGALYRKLKQFRLKIQGAKSLFSYWKYSLVPKKKDLWVFSGFYKRGYLDNTKYFYEYVLEQHPEIQAYWLTGEEKVYQKLKKEGKPVCKFRTKECRKILSHAKIAVSDHYFMSDYDSLSGFNHGIQKVQLWHGVGLKNLGDNGKIFSTTVPGVQLSEDILVSEKDGLLSKMIKKLKYFRYACFRELPEEYFLLLCPGEDHEKYLAKSFHVPLERCFRSGHPRNIQLYKVEDEEKSKRKILYAPTFRWDVNAEEGLITKLLDSIEEIQATMEKLDAEFVIRLHPHTWRNYQYKITNRIETCNRIEIDREPDIYQTLGEYSIMISDYSSIAFDFIMLDRPLVFLCPDLEQFFETEVKLNHDFMEYSPGMKAESWTEALIAVEKYMDDPKIDSEWRRRIAKEFFDMTVNDERNSERIVQEIKKRINLV